MPQLDATERTGRWGVPAFRGGILHPGGRHAGDPSMRRNEDDLADLRNLPELGLQSRPHSGLETDPVLDVLEVVQPPELAGGRVNHGPAPPAGPKQRGARAAAARGVRARD
eukprot:8886698-Pyramimonas_sp.AAC.1